MGHREAAAVKFGDHPHDRQADAESLRAALRQIGFGRVVDGDAPVRCVAVECNADRCGTVVERVLDEVADGASQREGAPVEGGVGVRQREFDGGLRRECGDDG